MMGLYPWPAYGTSNFWKGIKNIVRLNFHVSLLTFPLDKIKEIYKKKMLLFFLSI